MRILSLNVRGFGSPVKWRYVKEIIRKEGIKMLCLQEVRMNNFNLDLCCKLWGDNDIDFLYSEPANGSGGILMIWHKVFFQCTSNIINKRFIVFSRLSKEKNISVVVVNVYSSCLIHEKTQMWSELLEIR